MSAGNSTTGLQATEMQPIENEPSKTKPSLLYPTRINPATIGPHTSSTMVALKCIDDGKNRRRHAKQLSDDRIGALNNLPDLIIDATEYCACYEVDSASQASTTLNGQVIFQPHLYLFSLLIACEWQPSLRTIQSIQMAAAKASDFLYDVTDGFMAIGQVIIGGNELLDVADIQVMASNRFHPRSWISALHEAHKFQPVRLGRGLWRKDQGFVVPWDEADSHRVMVHEWGHYALELVDEYLDLVHVKRSAVADAVWQGNVLEDPIDEAQKQSIRTHPPSSTDLYMIAPSIALSVDTIMSTLASSELLPRHGSRSDKQRSYMQNKLKARFPNVVLNTPLDGPPELPIAGLPLFRRSVSSAPLEEVALSTYDLRRLHELLVPPDAPNIHELKILGSPWIYILKTSAETPQEKNRIIGQGVLSKRDWQSGFTLLGAQANDQVVVVAQVADTAQQNSEARVVRGELVVGGLGEIDVQWSAITPRVAPNFIDVLPAEKRPVMTADESQLPAQVRIQIETTDFPAEAWISALGQTPAPLAPDPALSSSTRWMSEIAETNHLDGHILLRWSDGSMYVCAYSHGGGPCTGGGGYCVCYTAGSYEGNSMLFYRDNYDASDQTNPPFIDNQIDDQGTRIVSTVMHSGHQYVTLSSGAVVEARSYIFSLGSNQPLNKHSATLVLYYDDDARKRNGDLLVYRWQEGADWQPLTTYAPESRPYLCIPLDQATSETSGGRNEERDEYFDRYRIYWTPRSS